MSESDSFIEEVTEEVRRDRLFALMRKYGWIGITVVLLIVAGAAWSEWQKAQAKARAQAFGDAVIAALTSDDKATALDTVEATGDQAVILGLIASATALEAEDRAQAIAVLNEIASRNDAPDSLRQLARLKGVILAGTEMDADARSSTLTELAAAGAPFRALAMEQQALMMLETGDTAGAIVALSAILNEPALTQGLQARVRQLIVALGGTLDGA